MSETKKTLEERVCQYKMHVGSVLINDLWREVKQLRADIGNLLAIIHRDGGHHEGEVGTKQAIEDAKKVYYDLRAENAEMMEALEEARKVIEGYAEYELSPTLAKHWLSAYPEVKK